MLGALLKRDGRLFLRGLLPALILTCLLAIACGVASTAASKGAERQTDPVKVALVDNEDSLLSRISISMVTDQSYMSSLMTITQEDDESVALEKMREGEYGAVVSLPDGYMEKIMHGENCKGKIYISDALENEGELIESISDFGARLLTAGQLGVFAGERVIAEKELGEDVHSQFLENSNAKLITFALDAYDSIFSFEVLPYASTGVSMTMYYAACWIVLLIFVVGLFFPELYITDCKGSIYARLKTYGMSSFEFMFGKVLFPTIFRIAIAIITSIILKFDAVGTLTMCVLSLFASLITSNLAVALSKKGGWSVAILAMSAVCLFIAGGLVPRTMLPEILPKIAMYTPFGAGLSMVLSCVKQEAPEIKSIIIAAIYAAIFIAVAFNAQRHFPKSNEEVRL